MKKMTVILATLILVLGLGSLASAHCEIPCGIYGDEARFQELREHLKTIEKAMKQISMLSKGGNKNYNQLVRWIVNKEEHAKRFQYILWQYFLTQRVKLPKKGDKNYLLKLELLHRLTVYAMKCKQTTDLKWVSMAGQALARFEKVYKK